MKRNVRNALAISGIAITMGATGLIYDSSANSGIGYGAQGPHREKMMRFKKTEHPKNHVRKYRPIMGIVLEKKDDCLVIRRNKREFTVKIDSDSRILNQKWQKVNFSDIRKGDKIRVFGELSDSTITARTIRDISIK